MLACALLCAGFWVWARTIVLPANTAQGLVSHWPVGNNSDLYARWLGAREALLHQRSPYSADFTREIQTGFYGRRLDANNPLDPKAKESFVYPLYVIFLFAPAIHLPFPLVAELFRWLLLLCIALSVPLWMRAVGFHTKWRAVASGILLALASNPALAEYSQQNLTALALFFLAAGAAFAVTNRFVLGGCLLALATIKPDITLSVVLWLLLWAAFEKDRRNLLWGFAGSMALLVAAAEVVLPGWMGSFLAAVREYSRYGTDPSILEVLLGSLVAKVAAAGMVVWLVVWCWRARKCSADSLRFRWTLALISSGTLVLIPKLAAYNHLLLIPALLVLLRERKNAANFFGRAVIKSAFACQIWQWLAAAALAAVSLLTGPAPLLKFAHLPLYTWLALPVVTFLAVATVIPDLFRRHPENPASQHG